MGKRRSLGRRGRIDRREILQLGAGLAVFAAGCGSSEGDSGAPPVGPNRADASSDPPKQPPVGPGSTPPPPVVEDAGAETPDASSPDLTPNALLAGIDTIVVLMMENRSFDHYLGRLKSDLTYPAAGRVNGLYGSESNPDSQGVPVQVFKLDTFTPPDPPHLWDACHAQWNLGQNDGFVKAHAGPAERDVMGGHDREQIPFMYWLADNFTVCDAWFASVMGPTWPNRYYLHATSSNGEKFNTPFAAGRLPTVWERLKAKGFSAKNYYAGGIGWFAGAFPGKLFTANPLVKMDEFFADAKNGTLPNFSLIDPDFMANDDHPSHNIQRGQAFIASVYNALAASPQWGRCLFVITYDEHGGFYDHVAPPTCADEKPEFRQLGFRVPTIIVGPTVRRGHVLSTQLEHASVAATLALRFGIASLSERMDKANHFAGAIDPALVGKPIEPAPVPPQVSFPFREAWIAEKSESSQPMLEAMARNGTIPARFVDTRTREERLTSWIRHAEALGAIAHR